MRREKGENIYIKAIENRNEKVLYFKKSIVYNISPPICQINTK